MSGVQPRNCAVGECASSFMYKDECALVASGCCCREMLAAVAKLPHGARFPMDLRPGGNPFVNAMKAAGLVIVSRDVTRLAGPPA